MAAVAQLREPDDQPLTQAVGQFTVTLNLTQQRGITMVGYVYLGDTPTEINARIDAYQDALDRQFVRADVVAKRAKIAAHTQNLENFRAAYEALVEKKNKGGKLTSQEITHVGNYDSTVREIMRQIDSERAAIVEAEKQLKG